MIDEDIVSNLIGFTLLMLFAALIALPFLFLVTSLSIYEIKLMFDWINSL
jgi:hypothetical protein